MIVVAFQTAEHHGMGRNMLADRQNHDIALIAPPTEDAKLGDSMLASQFIQC